MPYYDKQRRKWRGKVMRQRRTRTEFFDTRRSAREWENDQKELPLGEFLSGTRTVSLLLEWADKYLDDIRPKCVDKTYQEKVLAFRLFFKAVRPQLEPSLLTKSMVLAHFNTQAKERSGSAANKDRKNLIAAWNWAAEYLPAWPRVNPFKEVKRQRSEQSPRYVPPVEDFWKVYDALPMGQDKVMLFAYLHTAARRGELFRLRWNEVDFDRHRIKLWTRKRKGGLEADLIPMTTDLESALAWWRDNRTFPGATHVFLCESKVPCQVELRGQPFVERHRWLAHLCERAGVRPFGIHAIRHLSASILDDAGQPITVIQGVLRHKSANTTAKYLHKLRGMRVVLDEAFRRPTLDESASAKEKADQVRSDRPRLRVIAGSSRKGKII